MVAADPRRLAGRLDLEMQPRSGCVEDPATMFRGRSPPVGNVSVLGDQEVCLRAET
jgi:hypothetical protein